MGTHIKKLSKLDEKIISERLEEYDNKYIENTYEGSINLGYYIDEKLVAGVIADITTFNILYVSELFVDEEFRRKGIAKTLMLELEKRAKYMNVNMIRLDTFDYQGKDFYLAIGYKLAGSYTNDIDGYSEYFFYKSI